MSDGAIGRTPARVGGVERVTGRQAYVADIGVEDALHARLVTVDCARARIRSIDTSAALRIPGVRLVVTADDLPDPMPRFGPQFRDRPVLAGGETHYHGEPVAAVAADTKDAAEEAAGLVRIDYEELPAVFTVAAALDPAAPLVQDPSLRPGDPLAATNVLREHRYGWGDVDAATADLVVEGTYAFPMVTQFAIEPHGFIAAPDGDGIAVWSSIQHPYWLQRVIAGILHLPLAKVRVFAPDPGGAFGGKQHAKYEPLVAFMALKAGRPVRLILSLEETFQAVRRGASEIHVRTGFGHDGQIRVPRHRGELPDRRLRRHRRPDGRQGELHGERSVPRARGPDLLAEHPVAHRAIDRVPWLRKSPADLGGRIEHRRGRPRPSGSTRLSSAFATWHVVATGSSRPTRRRTATGRRR